MLLLLLLSRVLAQDLPLAKMLITQNLTAFSDNQCNTSLSTALQQFQTDCNIQPQALQSFQYIYGNASLASFPSSDILNPLNNLTSLKDAFYKLLQNQCQNTEAKNLQTCLYSLAGQSNSITRTCKSDNVYKKIAYSISKTSDFISNLVNNPLCKVYDPKIDEALKGKDKSSRIYYPLVTNNTLPVNCGTEIYVILLRYNALIKSGGISNTTNSPEIQKLFCNTCFKSVLNFKTEVYSELVLSVGDIAGIESVFVPEFPSVDNYEGICNDSRSGGEMVAVGVWFLVVVLVVF